jgi:adenine-specific DNA-methyltransferase
MGSKRHEDANRPIDAIVHRSDKRTNIPTRELRGFVRDEEMTPKTAIYPRDSSLDPQLVWNGKDETDSHSLEIPIVPVYIQEKVSPQALIEDLRLEASRGKPRQATLFADFNGISFDKMVDFYHHEQNWTNRMILGDSLLVMTSLGEKEGLKGKVQLIYVDPPYGITFDSNWQVSTRKRVVKDGKAEDASRQPEQVRAFRDTWSLGIHSYLNYLRDRFTAARELLTESGSIVVQIGDENLHLVRSVLDEVFGSENAHPLIVFRKKMMPLMKEGGFESVFDYLVWYQKNKADAASTLHRLFERKTPEGDSSWSCVELPNGSRRRMTPEEISNHSLLTDGARIFQPISMLPREYRENQDFKFKFEGTVYSPPKGVCWSTTKEGMERLARAKRLYKSGDEGLRYVYFFDDYPVGRLTANWMDTSPASDMHYVVETNTKVIERIMLTCTNPGDLVLDPTCGGGTTAFVAEEWGRRWITIDTSRVAVALARTRLMSARYPYYLLRDSPEGVAKESERLGRPTGVQRTSLDVKKGFVCEEVPHITLGAIANCQEIVEGISRRDANRIIAREAASEKLLDRPFEDPRRVRVSGPFTVESLSPHRIVGQNEDDSKKGTGSAPGEVGVSGFVPLVLDHLRKAGIQNTVKSERLTFDRLDIYPGTYLNAEGDYTENGRSKRVAICIGPENGTVGPDLLKEAAKEAVVGRGFDLLVVCGFAFDPYVSEEAKQYGKLSVLVTRMNPDLAMGDDLLKKTGAGNLFMVFGEPDLLVSQQKDGKRVITVRGIDVYDPTTGQIRSHSTDDIACWFIDTDYNGESFFVRHAYFCGKDQPYDKLKRALHAEVNEDAWKALYSTVSRPFEIPKTGKIAVKVINHYGDEVLKVLKLN